MGRQVPVDALDDAAQMIEALQFENADLRAEVEKLRLAVVWAMRNFAFAWLDGRSLHFDTVPEFGDWLKNDGTDTGLINAVLRAIGEEG